MKKSIREKLDLIVCPVCGREYFPAEIFVPGAFFGKPVDIHRDSSGKVDGYYGTTMDTMETYVCDTCGSDLEINANVKFKVSVDTKTDFNQDYTTKIYENRVYLKEENIIEQA